jgi:riboflavin kinase/FMN adenylyltransferase
MAVHNICWHAQVPDPCRGGFVTIGNFDGVHRGHQLLIDRARNHAQRSGVPTLAVTFEPHPLRLLRPDAFQPTLTTLDDRLHLLHGAGADHVAVLETEPSLLALSAADFFDRVIRDNLHAAGLIEGPNFGFGHNREGTVETLLHFCVRDGLMLEIVEPLRGPEGVVSSSRIRNALLAGDVAAAASGLGRSYRLTGLVGVGQRRGAGLGFPTANLTQVPTIIPGDGVYAVRAWIGRVGYTSPGTSFPGAVNIGPNPTFGEQARKVEVHLVGFEGDLYGQPVTIEFVARLRETRKFAAVEELLAQVQADVAQVTKLVSVQP